MRLDLKPLLQFISFILGWVILFQNIERAFDFEFWPMVKSLIGFYLIIDVILDGR